VVFYRVQLSQAFVPIEKPLSFPTAGSFYVRHICSSNCFVDIFRLFLDVSYTGFRPKAAFLLLEKVCVVVVIVVRVIF
jgi:hypothetical protein